MTQQRPFFPSEQGRCLQLFVCAPVSRTPFYQQPMPTAWKNERCLQHTVGQRNQPSFSWDEKRSPLSWKGEILDMPGTYRLVQCAQTIGRFSGPHFWKGNVVWIKACSPPGLSCSPTLFNRLAGTTEYVLYNNGVEDPQRYGPVYGWATGRGIP